LNHFKSVVRTAFNQRRKKLSNSLKAITGNFALPENIQNKRAEELTPSEFEELTIILERAGIFRNFA
jgi:16S rRNA (adenine1518-N6/adenine1519-N6)-dimethyltransferase